MYGVKKLAPGVFPESWKMLAERRRRQRKLTKKSPPETQDDSIRCGELITHNILNVL